MELRQFRYFIAVAEELHFSRAAQRLHIGQPPLSLQIQAIERELGVLLLKRDRRKVELTDAGRLFLVEARNALEQAQRAIDTAKRFARGEVGTLRVHFTTSAPLLPNFPKAIRHFHEHYPSVHLELKIQTSQAILGALTLGNLDVGFVRPAARTVLPRQVSSIPLYKDRLMLVLPAAHPLAAADGPVPLAELADEDFLLRPAQKDGGFYEQIFSLCADAGFTPRVVQETQDTATAFGLVAAGLGVTIAPESLQAIHLADIVWKEIDVQSGAESQVLLVYREDMASPLRDKLIECFRAVVSPGGD
ncbi:LysR substrate-binding domain-containing protein [Flavisphingomonas formosensis]|uniref:LysR substrate-binding domain-containing protein n=1 Tax=Flavisphingomonas formosensis TaxID=861534 RepID=UPI0012F93BCE|nr:LysR substrate-binding domain-containing protein [Sphingomonas formosensis]